MHVKNSNCVDISDANKLEIDVNTESIQNLNTNKKIKELDNINNDDSISEIDDIYTMEYHIPVPKCTKNYVPASIAIMDTIASTLTSRFI